MPKMTAEESQYLDSVIKKYGVKNTGAGSGQAIPTMVRQKSDISIGLKTKQPKKNLIQNIVTQGADIVGDVGRSVGNYVANTPKYFYEDVNPFLQGVADVFTGNLSRDIGNNNQKIAALDEQRNTYSQLYKSGKMSKQNYVKALDDIANQYQEIGRDSDRIASQADRGNVVQSALMTGGSILAAGKYAPTKAVSPAIEMGIKDAFQFGTRSGASNLLFKAGKTLENIGTHNPAIRDLIERNALRFADGEVSRMAGEGLSQYITREGKNLAFGMLIKRPIVYQSNIGGGEHIYNDILSGDYDQALKTSAFLGSQMLKGGPIGVFYSGAKWIKGRLRNLAYGKQSFIDGISRRIGNGNPNQVAKFIATIKEKAPKEFEDVNRVFRILQETNLRSSGENVESAVDSVLNHYTQHGFDLSNLTPSQIYKDMKNWADADALWQKTLRQGLIPGITPEEAGKYVVVRWDIPTKEALARAIASSKDMTEAAAAVENLANRPGVGWGNNRILMNKISKIMADSQTPEEAAAAIKKIRTAGTIIKGAPKEVIKESERLGFSLAAPKSGRKTPIIESLEDTRKLVSSAADNNTDLFDPYVDPQPQLAAVSGAISHAGLSPTAENDLANRALGEALVANLDELEVAHTLNLKDTQGNDLVNGGRAILSELQTYMEHKKPLFHIGQSAAVTDLRQLRYNEIEEALGTSRGVAKQISKAIIDAYTKIPMEFRGAGDKAVDYWYQLNPFQKYYSRIQSGLRYTYNPFFRLQERVETKVLSHAQANNLLWNRAKSELDEGVKILEDSGIFQYGQIGEAAQEIGTGQFAKKGLAKISANLTGGQKRDLAGLAYDMADKMGMDMQQLVIHHPDKIDDALRVVVQYGRKGTLSSPLARTLNLVFFPMRYNLKVTKLAADLLAKQPHAIQLATIHSLFKMDDYLQSPEGIKWQAEHAEALKALNWILPTNSVAQVLNMLGFNTPLSGASGNDKFSIGELGQLGGLPFGIISQILDKNHIIQLNKPYVDPGTGQVFPDYVPANLQAKAAQAITDLLGSMFTYPGRTLGLPGKTDILRKLTDIAVPTDGSDFNKDLQLERLTPLQQQWIKVLQGDHSPETIDSLYNSPAPGQFNWYTLPPLRFPEYNKIPVPPKAAKGKRKKIAQPIS